VHFQCKLSYISKNTLQAFENLGKQEATSLTGHDAINRETSFSPKNRITSHPGDRTALTARYPFLFYFRVIPLLQDGLVQSFPSFPSSNRYQRIMLHTTQVASDKSEEQLAEPFCMQPMQQRSHLFQIQGSPTQHDSHIANLLQAYPIRQDMPLDMQDETNKIQFLITRLGTPAD
jgi:hypothetical protein